MMNAGKMDDFARSIGKMIEASPAKDVEKNVKAMLQSGLARLDMVPRNEFDVQVQLLARACEKLEALEARVAQLEAQLADPSGSG